ncbi:MAG: sugar porter family MFS transporter [Planctomycetota bacterium]
MTEPQGRASYPLLVALVVAMGGFLMGFDSAVISGVVDPVRAEFKLTADEVGWAVACLTLGSTIAMAFAGPLADRLGRKRVLMATAALFTVSAIGSALAPSNLILVIARIVGGFGVGGALLIAPIYIAEIAPPAQRGRLVSFNQLNIVLGFSAAFFSNYFLEGAGMSWRWMLGVEAIPAVLYLVLLTLVPESPRWLAGQGHDARALAVLERVNGPSAAATALRSMKESLAQARNQSRARLSDIFNKRMRRVMVIALGLGFFQQITGINAIFYYSTTIFAMAGAARDIALGHAILVGLVNVFFTLIAMRLIDRAGRKPLLLVGTAVMTAALFTNAAAFSAAKYRMSVDTVDKLSAIDSPLPPEAVAALRAVQDREFGDQLEFNAALRAAAAEQGPTAVAAIGGKLEDLAKDALEINGLLVLIAICGFIAGFAISLGPVMWAMFSEIFPTHLRGLAISVAGFFNSAVSFGVQQLFPRGMETLGPAGVFAIFGSFAALAFLFTIFIIPETKGRTLEELEALLVRD